MSPIVKIICLSITLAWIQTANAAGTNTSATAEPPPPSHGVAIKAKPIKKMDRARVEKRLADKAALAKARSEQAKKSKAAQDQKDSTVTAPR